MKQHTPEPWAWFETEDGAASCVAEGMAVARCNVHDPFGQDAINARRIAACVNACAGIPTEELEQFHATKLSDGIKLIAVTKQRDELLAALENLLPWVVTQTIACNGMKCRELVCISCTDESDAEKYAQEACDRYRDAKHVIASVKGGAE